jgi:hypothetical protein
MTATNRSPLYSSEMAKLFEAHPERTEASKRPSFAQALLWILVSILFLVGVVIWLSPASSRVDNLMKLAALFTSWPVVVGIIALGVFAQFGDELSAYIKNAKLKYKDLELMQQQPNAPFPVIEAVREKEEALSQEGGTESSIGQHEPKIGLGLYEEVKEHLLAEVKKREEEAHNWKYLYLDSFLVDRSKNVLSWISSFRGSIPSRFFNAKWEKFFTSKTERAQTLRLLTDLGLIRTDSNRISVTPEGKAYLDHYAIVVEESGQTEHWPHPFISRDEIDQYSK